MSQNLTQPEEIDLALSSITECEMQGGMPSQDEVQAGANPDFGMAGVSSVPTAALRVAFACQTMQMKTP